ncbi:MULTISPECIES: DUF6510 family protein [Streptomyces]|uniref:DUF6510 family protein n=1 Tax=Streptomyces kebangsaanensis TaxID=864058 RepID=A0ABW6L700_9ACTN|nr:MULTISPECIES: DUF6510 family protein [Streptomyces]PZH15726.1 hypothetical protein C1I97_07745 [Streptomyces sp. NTH33]
MNAEEDLLSVPPEDGYVDGNAVAGAMSLALGRDATTIVLQCAECGDRHRVAETRVYLRCPGMVVRCPACSACEVLLVDRPRRLQLTLMSIRMLELP